MFLSSGQWIQTVSIRIYRTTCDKGHEMNSTSVVTTSVISYTEVMTSLNEQTSSKTYKKIRKCDTQEQKYLPSQLCSEPRERVVLIYLQNDLMSDDINSQWK